MLKRIINGLVHLFFFIFIIPNTILNFLSGVFVATAINIVTSQLPNSILSIGVKYLVIAVQFFGVAVLLVGWSLLTEKAHIQYNENKRHNTDLMALWYGSLQTNRTRAFLAAILVLLVVLLYIAFKLLL